MNIDPLNILLLAVALVVFWRLRSVLGTRTGTEKPPIEPFETKRTEAPKGQEANATVVRFPQNGQTTRTTEPSTREPEEPVWSGYAAPGSDLAAVLGRLAESDPAFMPRSFVEGAKMAYEMIVESFAKGDKATLKNLLSREVFDGFSRAIDEREAQGRKVESRFVGIGKATIQSASLAGKKASITMEFVSELISATYDASGGIIEGDPKQIQEITDVWTFERDVTSRNPNWKLMATQAPA